MPDSPETPDFAVREVEATAPRLREGLRWTFQESRGEGSYLLEDPLSGKYYRLGRREHEFVKRLDGCRSLYELVAQAAAGDPGLALEGSEIASLVRMLVDAGLVVTGSSEHAHRVWEEVNRPQESKRLLGKGSQLLFLKVPLGNPDRFFTWLARRAGWLASPGFALVWLALVLWAGATVYGERERFLAQMAGLFDFGTLWILGVLWLVLKLVHECWHGLVCRKFGGPVPEAGVTLLLLTTPLGYVNASSSTALQSKWQRIAVSGAGIYGELLLAAIAALLWARVEPGGLSAALHQVVVLASVTTLLFNANPLLRFDGYYILADWLGIPNLYSKGQSATRWLLRRGVLGMKKAMCPLRPDERRAIVFAYGIAAGVWRILIIVGLLVAAAFLFEGAGILIALVAGGAMLLQSLLGAKRYLERSAAAEGLRPSRLALRVALILSVLAALLFGWEVTPQAKAPAVVRDASGGEVRARCPGFLVEIAVRDGQEVAAGELLARLENAEETARLRQLENEIEGSRLRRDHHLHHGRVASSLAEAENLASLEATAAELREHVATLELRAPHDGAVDARRLALLLGTWIEPGRRLLEIVAEDRKELLVLAAAEDRDHFEQARAAGRQLDFRPRGRWGSVPAALREVVPRAMIEPPHFALIAPAAGPLPVRQRGGAAPSAPGGEDPTSRAASAYELTKPRFEIRAELEPDSLLGLRDGEIGVAAVRAAAPASLASWAWKGLRGRFDQLVDSHLDLVASQR